MDRLAEAVALAARCHAGQVCKAGQPYILHPLRVMMRMATEDERIVAVLHDTVEDSGMALPEIVARFGEGVGSAVDALSRRDGETYAAFIDRVRQNPLAVAVKRADIADNTDEERLALLPVELADRLRAKYAAVSL